MEFDTSEGFKYSPASAPLNADVTPGLFPADAGRSAAFDPRVSDVSSNAILAGGARTDVTEEQRKAASEKITKALNLPTGRKMPLPPEDTTPANYTFGANPPAEE